MRKINFGMTYDDNTFKPILKISFREGDDERVYLYEGDGEVVGFTNQQRLDSDPAVAYESLQYRKIKCVNRLLTEQGYETMTSDEIENMLDPLAFRLGRAEISVDEIQKLAGISSNVEVGSSKYVEILQKLQVLDGNIVYKGKPVTKIAIEIEPIDGDTRDQEYQAGYRQPVSIKLYTL